MANQAQEQMIMALHELGTASTKADKQAVMVKHANTPHFKEALKYLLNSFDVVGLSTKKMNKDVAIDTSITDFSELLNYLRQHPTGTDAAIAKARGFVSTFDDPFESDIVNQLITKTLTLGVSAKSVNKVYGDDFIPTFDVQLAFPYAKKIETYADDANFYVTQKLDGHRALTTVDTKDGKIRITTYTRRGQQMDGMTELHTDMIEFIRRNPRVMANFRDGFAIDGELLLENRENLSTAELFQATSKVLRAKGEKEHITYNVFDILPLNEFLYSTASKQPYSFRRETWLDHLEASQMIHVIPVLDIITRESIPQWSDYATQEGWEGVMLNAADGYYRKTRSPQLLKVKKMHTADLEIVGFNEATSGKFKGQLQSLNVRLNENDIVQVGSGLSEEIRADIWAHKDKYLGKMAEIQYFEETTNDNGGKSLRFPVFKNMRPDKNPEDANIE